MTEITHSVNLWLGNNYEKLSLLIAGATPDLKGQSVKLRRSVAI